MNAQTKQSNKFSLAVGTTNRHQWHKKAVKALQILERLRLERRELFGTVGGDEHESITSIMFGDTENQLAEDLHNEIGERHGWLITRENAADILADTLKAITEAREAMPVIDNRRTPEQIDAQAAERQEAEEKRQIEAAEKAEQVNALKTELMQLYSWAVADDGSMSPYARAAKNMKKELSIAFPYVKFSVTSDSFSMGNSVRVEWDNGPSTKQVDAITDKYMYYIDKCTDDNSARARAVSVVLGQSKYVTTQRNIDESIKEQVKADIMARANIDGWQVSEFVWRALSGVEINGEYAGVELVNCDYVAQFKAPEIIEAPVQPGGVSAHIEQHEHTKRGFTMYLVVLDSRVERDEFNDLRDQCKSAGGWYSRKWGRTPGGFAFKESDKAGAFLALITGQAPPSGGSPSPKKPKGDKLRGMADKLESQIADKLAPRQENTAKRQAQAAHARLEGERLKRTQSALYALADMHDAGQVPPVLANIGSKKAVYDLMSEKLDSINNGYHGYHVGTGEMHDTNQDNPQAVALWSLLKPKSEAEKQADELAQKVRELQGCKIPGYFPTPDAVLDIMFDGLNVFDGIQILEPEIGSAAIADRFCEIYGEQHRENIQGVEINHTLAEISKAKGYAVLQADFMKCVLPARHEDLILMNPPFENLQDCDHVQKAFGLLKSGGQVRSIMSPAFEYHSTKKAHAFREWLDGLTHEVIDIPAGAFKESGTMIASKLLIIDKN